MSIGSRIREAREAKNITLEALGAACGTTKQTIYKYETGVITNIPMDKIEGISKFLSVSPAYIMGWENASGETDLGLSAVDIAKWIDADPSEVSTVMDEMSFSNGLDSQAIAKIVAEVEKRKPTPVTESGQNRNVLRLAGRDGSYVERNLTDEQMAAIKMMIEQLPDADDL